MRIPAIAVADADTEARAPPGVPKQVDAASAAGGVQETVDYGDMPVRRESQGYTRDAPAYMPMGPSLQTPSTPAVSGSNSSHSSSVVPMISILTQGEGEGKPVEEGPGSTEEAVYEVIADACANAPALPPRPVTNAPSLVGGDHASGGGSRHAVSDAEKQHLHSLMMQLEELQGQDEAPIDAEGSGDDDHDMELTNTRL